MYTTECTYSYVATDSPQLASSTCNTDATSTFATSTPAYTGVLSADGVVCGAFLFIVILLLVWKQ